MSETGGTNGISQASINNSAELAMLVENNLTAKANQCEGLSVNEMASANSDNNGFPSAWYNATAASPTGGMTVFGGTRVFATPDARHFEGLNVGFADGHVKWLKRDKVITPPATIANWRLWFPAAP